MVTSRQGSATSTRRDAWVEVDLGAIEFNVKMILAWLERADSDGTQTATDPQEGSESRLEASAQSPYKTASQEPRNRKPRAKMLMAVVKSDAYGHGAAGVAEVLIGSGAQWLGVASVDEGCQVRAVDSKIPILILSPAPVWAVPTALDQNLDLTITDVSQIAEIADTAARKRVRARVHLKVDTGMHRLGIAPADIEIALKEIEKSKNLRLVSVLSHLANADQSEATTFQNEQFAKVVQLVTQREEQLIESGVVEREDPLIFHLASSDATRLFPLTHYDMARVGLALYGLEANKSSTEIVPAMSVRARINQIKIIEAGESVGYGWTWTAKEKTHIASVPIGYADGVDRGLSNKMHGLLMGQQIPQVGRISMDQMLFDVTAVPEAQEGDVITLIGTDGERNIDIASWAIMLDTITYELACRMRVRLPRIYTRHRHPRLPQS